MNYSQFQIYQSTDSGAPSLYGITGSLVNVLTKVLVTGYGTKTGAGWTADFTSSTSSGSTFRPPSGSRFYLSIQDDSPVPGGAAAREVRIRCFESMTSNSGSTVYNSGSGQFPKIGQGISSNGYLVHRKSTSADSVPRAWTCFVDAYTMYFFSQEGSAAVSFPYWYSMFGFGDIFTYASTMDNLNPYRAFVMANETENSPASDLWANLSLVNTVVAGHYMARTVGGRAGSSANTGKTSDTSKNNNIQAMYGALAFPNPADRGVYMSPVWMHEIALPCIRGKMRGFWNILHSPTNFSDGEIIYGTNENVGRVFQVIKPSYNTYMAAIEISNTVETNA
jgi:hypothetical protein